MESKHGAGMLPLEGEEALRGFWRMALHLLSFLNFDGARIRELFRHAPPAGEDAPPAPPWGGSTLQAFLEAGGAGRSRESIGGSRDCGSATHTQREEGLPTVPVSPGLGLSVPIGVSFYRITAVAFRTRSAAPLPAAIAMFSTWQRVGFNH